jgi:hypothetical protein
VIAPGAVVDVDDPGELADAGGWGVFFPPEALDALGRRGPFRSPQLGCCVPPLLRPFAERGAGSVVRLQIPAGNGPAAALPVLDALATDPTLTRSHRVWSVPADMLRRLGERRRAAEDYDRARAGGQRRGAALPHRRPRRP